MFKNIFFYYLTYIAMIGGFGLHAIATGLEKCFHSFTFEISGMTHNHTIYVTLILNQVFYLFYKCTDEVAWSPCILTMLKSIKIRWMLVFFFMLFSLLKFSTALSPSLMSIILSSYASLS